MSLRAHDGGASARPQEDSEYGSNLLIEDYPILVSPKLAQAIGLEESIVVQQLHWLFKNVNNGRMHDGHRWIFNTIEQWREQYFPFWSPSTIQRIFSNLETMMLVISCQPEGVMSRRKYYRLNRGMVKRLQDGRILKPKKKSKWDNLRSCQVDKIDVSTGHIPNTETSLIDFTSKASAQCAGESDRDLKALALEKVRMPLNIPPFEEFDEFCGEQGLDEILFKRSDTYDKMIADKWHHWNGKTLRPIRYWQKYVIGLNDHMSQH